MRTGFFLGWAAIIAIITGLIVFAILDYNSEGKAARACEARGGRIVKDCPEHPHWCTSTGRTTSCAEIPCKQRCLERR